MKNTLRLEIRLTCTNAIIIPNNHEFLTDRYNSRPESDNFFLNITYAGCEEPDSLEYSGGQR